MLAKGFALDMEFRCPRCKSYFTLRALKSPNPQNATPLVQENHW
nr:hypothetical protein [Desulfovibrio fairfieldensis]